MNTKDNMKAILVLALFGMISPKAGGEASDAFPFLRKWNPKQCVAWGDALSDGEAQNRLRWARRCATEYESYYRYGEKYADPKNMRQMLYPLFGVFDESGKIANPLRYFPPFFDVDPSDCDLPMEYQIVGLCEAFPDL